MKLPSDDDDPPPSRDQIEELERLEQETTLVLQDIDRNLARANSIINNRILPKVKGYAQECDRVWSNVGFWKHFFERSANVVLDTDGGPVATTNSTSPNLHMFNDTIKLMAGHLDPTPDSIQSLLMEPIPSQHLPEPSATAKKTSSGLSKSTPLLDSTPTWSTNQVNNQYLASTPQPPASKDQANSHPQTTNDDSTGSLNMPPLVSDAMSKGISSLSRLPVSAGQKAVALVQTEDFLSPQRVPGDPLIESSPSFPLKPVLVSDYPVHDDDDDDENHGEMDPQAVQERSFSPPPQLTLTIHSIYPRQDQQPRSSPTRNSDGSFSPIPLPPSLSPTKPTNMTTAVTDLEVRVPSLLSEYRIPELQTDYRPYSPNTKRPLADLPPTAKRTRRAFDVANEEDNVFLEDASHSREVERSVKETTFQSIPDHGPDLPSATKEKTSEISSQSHSMSRLFDAAVLSASKDVVDEPMVEGKNMFSNLSESFADQPNADQTGDSTNDLLPEYREKFKQLTASFRKRS